MATAKKSSSTPPRKPIAEVRKENEQLHNRIEQLENSGFCHMCGKHKSKENFYMSTDPHIKSGITSVCKDCARDIACRYDHDKKEYLGCTKESVMKALEYLDKPYIAKLWDSAYYELHDETIPDSNRRKTIWGNYIKNISMNVYNGLRWKDSDIFTGSYYAGQLNAVMSSQEEEEIKRQREKELKERAAEYEQNKSDVIRIFNYDPFEYESEEDKPLMYAQVINMTDTSDESEDDVIKLNSIVEIVKYYNQLDKINRQLSKLQNDTFNIVKNTPTIKSLKTIQKDTIKAITDLAKESKLSKASSGTSTKGTNTWTGKVKILKEMKLREEEVNAFEVETCRGMQQVAELSDAAILKQINLDENDYAGMLTDQRKIITDLRKQKNLAEERMRILYRENVDLKELLADNDISIDKDLQSNYLFLPQSEKEESDADSNTRQDDMDS